MGPAPQKPAWFVSEHIQQEVWQVQPCGRRQRPMPASVLIGSLGTSAASSTGSTRRSDGAGAQGLPVPDPPSQALPDLEANAGAVAIETLELETEG